MNADVIVIGAGMTGLAAARELTDQGVHACVLDKGWGLGGRLAGKRFGDAVFDNGAQHITARDPRFRDLLETWAAAGHVKPWDLPHDGEKKVSVRWRGAPAMTALAKQLATGLDIHQSAQVSSIAQHNDHWACTLDTGDALRAPSVLITTPVPQAMVLLSAGGVTLEADVQEQLESIDYHRCFSVMAILADSSALPPSGGISFDSGPISWMADNQRKGISEKPAVTIHASPEFSLGHWDQDRDKTAATLLHHAAPWLGADVVEHRIHGWKFSMPVSVQEEDCLVLHDTPRLVIAGDAFGGARVEGAVLSGWAAAQALTTNS